MNPRQALEMLKQAAEKFLGTLQDHLNLQEATKALENLVSEHEAKQPAPEETVAEPSAEEAVEPQA